MSTMSTPVWMSWKPTSLLFRVHASCPASCCSTGLELTSCPSVSTVSSPSHSGANVRSFGDASSVSSEEFFKNQLKNNEYIIIMTEIIKNLSGDDKPIKSKLKTCEVTTAAVTHSGCSLVHSDSSCGQSAPDWTCLPCSGKY